MMKQGGANERPFDRASKILQWIYCAVPVRFCRGGYWFAGVCQYQSCLAAVASTCTVLRRGAGQRRVHHRVGLGDEAKIA